MSCDIIDGNRIASQLYGEIKERIDALKSKGHSLCLAFVLLGNDPASEVYVRMKDKKCAELGMGSTTFRLPYDTTEEQLLRKIDELNRDRNIQGMLVQLPLPKHIDEEKIINAIDPMKDVDCFHPQNVGRMLIGNPLFLPATPAGIQQLLIRSDIETAGKHVVIVGRSNIVGKPLAAMLMQRGKGADSTVTVVHSMTGRLADITRQADILVAAVGKPLFITADMVKDGAVVIDVGTNQIDDPTAPKGKRLVGDVDTEGVKEKASAITPVPGGVGPMTICMLMHNAVTAAEHAFNTDAQK
ncbi:MAG: bifunctional 5,10-methylene-tetrahydrofolate dehydrogenase/5,10-methylene-tetrahydrofolate cyclohydrolase [Candidatus Methanomethylophilaceae archaeon]|nr:bifunctional 5,10-methylene-tetrahydrofolate dehydrogenase/5,10-methylene-tetrahydrofolate cyclohydrolase [Candidatus Methanomethylophilaceae archaeon]